MKLYTPTTNNRGFVLYTTYIANKRKQMPKIIMYATSNDGDGYAMRIGEFDAIEDVVIHTGMFNNVEISFVYDNTRSRDSLEGEEYRVGGVQ